MRKILLWTIRFLIWAVKVLSLAVIVIVPTYFYIYYLWLRFFGPTGLTYAGDSVSYAHDMTEVLQIFVQILAIIIAGFWTYERFVKNKEETREDYPYPKIQHRIEHYDLGHGLIYLSVFVAVTNEGKRKLDLKAGKIFIRQVSPLPEKILRRIGTLVEENKNQDIQNGHDSDLFLDSGQRLRLDTLGDRKWGDLREKMLELEPGQTREIQFNFLIGSSIDVVEAISYFEYEKSGWELATLYPLKTQNTKTTSSKKLKQTPQGVAPARPTR